MAPARLPLEMVMGSVGGSGVDTRRGVHVTLERADVFCALVAIVCFVWMIICYLSAWVVAAKNNSIIDSQPMNLSGVAAAACHWRWNATSKHNR